MEKRVQLYGGEVRASKAGNKMRSLDGCQVRCALETSTDWQHRKNFPRAYCQASV